MTEKFSITATLIQDCDNQDQLPLVDELFNVHPNMTEAWEYVVSTGYMHLHSIFISK